MAQIELGRAARDAGRGTDMRRAAIAGFVGSLMEWDDFYLFGTASALVFPHLFFPAQEHLVATLLSFATFGVAFVARPVGGAVFGHQCAAHEGLDAERRGDRPRLVARHHVREDMPGARRRLQQFLRSGDGTVHALFPRRQLQLCAQIDKHLAALD